MEQQRGLVVAVTAARGGCGTTTLACTLALSAARRGLATLLVDGDEFGGGLDLVLGLEDVPGARWPDVLLNGTVVRNGTALENLPAVDLGRRAAKLRVLSHARAPGSSGFDPAEVARAAAATLDLVVLDVPCRSDRPVAAEADAVVLVVPAEVRACAAAALRLATWPRHVPVHLVVRGPAPGGLDADSIASALTVPLVAQLEHEPRLAVAIEAGRLTDLSGRSSSMRTSSRVLDALLAQQQAAA